MKFAEMLRKVRAEYNDDQPRDDDGQWTSGGGGGGGGGKGESDKGGGKSKKDFSDYDDWDPSDDYNRPDEYPGKDAPKALKEKLVKNSDRRLAVAEKEVAKAKKPIERAERRIDAAKKKEEEAQAAYEAAEQKESDAEEAHSEAVSELEENEEDLPVEQLRENEKKTKEALNHARKELDKAERKLERATEKIGSAEEAKFEAEEARLDAMAELEMERSWNDLHKADLIEDTAGREEEIDDCLNERERHLAWTKAKRTEADQELSKAQEKREELERYYYRDGLSFEDEYYEVRDQIPGLELSIQRAELKQHLFDIRIRHATDQVQFWKAVKEGGDLSGYWGGDLGDTDDEQEGTAEDRDGDGRTGEAEERDDDRDE